MIRQSLRRKNCQLARPPARHAILARNLLQHETRQKKDGQRHDRLRVRHLNQSTFDLLCHHATQETFVRVRSHRLVDHRSRGVDASTPSSLDRMDRVRTRTPPKVLRAGHILCALLPRVRAPIVDARGSAPSLGHRESVVPVNPLRRIPQEPAVRDREPPNLANRSTEISMDHFHQQPKVQAVLLKDRCGELLARRIPLDDCAWLRSRVASKLQVRYDLRALRVDERLLD